MYIFSRLWILIPLVLPATAILTSGGRIVTNQTIEAAQGSQVHVVCRGVSSLTWKKGAGSTATSLPDGVGQIRSSSAALLIINSLTPANKGVYTCHYGVSTIETVTIAIRGATQPPTVSTPTPSSAKVQGVAVTRTLQGSSPALRVSWSEVSGSGITYTVCYSTTSGTQSDPPSNANCDTNGIAGTSTTLAPLSRGTTYYIWVAAVASGERRPYSQRISAVIQQRIYTLDASEGEVNLENGATLPISPSKTYDILCSDTSYVKDWYRVDSHGDRSISRREEYRGSTPHVYATNRGGHALTLHIKSLRSTDSGEYECRLRSSGLPTLSVFLGNLSREV